jgi:Domain of unknown function (DUF4112)
MESDAGGNIVGVSPSRDVVGVPPTPPTERGPRGVVTQAARDIRDAHRRGPKDNTRPVPEWMRRLAWVLDDAFPVPATDGRRVGIDGFLTLIPGIGDAAGLVLSFIVVVAGVAAGVSIPTTIRMLINVGFEALVGLIPFAGAAFDMVYKANDRNVRLIERDLGDRRATRRSSLGVIAAVLVTIVVAIVMVVVIAVASVAVFVWVLTQIF